MKLGVDIFDSRELCKLRLRTISRLQRMAIDADDVNAYRVLTRLWWREYKDYDNGRGAYVWPADYDPRARTHG